MEGKAKVNKKSSRVRRVCHPPSPADGTRALAFVNVSNPEQVKDQATQRKIRRHVMMNIGPSRRKYSIHAIEQPQDIAAATALQQVPRSLPLPPRSCLGDVKICTNFKRLFHAMDMVSKGLLTMAVDDTTHKPRQRVMKVLCDVQHGTEQDQARSMYEIKQYTDSLGMVRKSIDAMESPASRYAIIGTVICLAYFDMRICNHEGWTLHMRGLENIVELYGGVEILEPHQALRQSLFLTDVLGSLIYDTHPRFPQLQYPSTPSHAAGIARKEKILHTPARFDVASLPDRTALIVIESATQSASRLALLLNHMPRDNAHQMALDLLIPVCRIAHDILSLPRLHHGSLDGGRYCAISQVTPISATAELVRLSALALVSTVITTTSGDDLYCAVYRRGLVRDLLVYTKAQGWAGWHQLKLWVLVVQFMMEIETARSQLLEEIIYAMDSLFLRSWEDLVSCLHQVAWLEDAAMEEMTQLKSDIEGRLAHKAKT